jgi:Ca2+-binding EF-hand superfamily protein
MRPVLLITLLVSASAAVYSEDDGLPDANKLFEELDRNRDGKLVADEISQEQVRFFERLLRVADKNKDGVLAKEEFLDAHKADASPNLPLTGLGGRGPGNVKQRFEMLDRNKDGKVTRDEIPDVARERLAPLFERFGKEALTLDDFRKMERIMTGEERPSPEQIFDQLDTNGDGKLSKADAPKNRGKRMLERVLEQTGKGADAEISRADFLANFPKELAERFGARRRENADRPEGPSFRGPKFLQMLDANHDGKLSKNELAKAAESFDELDANHDGELDLRELMGPPPEGMEPFTGRPEGPLAENRPRPETAAGGGPFFQRLDKDGDGKLAKDELPPRLKDRFEQLDRNGDGFVSAEELREAMPGRRQDGESSDRKPRPKRPEAE